MTTRAQYYIQLMRLDKPVGTFLLLWPTLSAVYIAGAGHPDSKILWIFILGTFVMRSAGCVINDWTDRDIDAHVERTTSRPLAKRALYPWEALILFLGLMGMALFLVLQLNRLTLYYALFGASITIIYPWMKRIIRAPQCILGIAFAWGIPMAYAAQLNDVPHEAWLLFAACVLWAVVYDTIYALVDKADDLKIGINSTAICFGQYTNGIIAILQVIIIALLWLFSQYGQLQTFSYQALIIASCFFIYQQYSLCKIKTDREFFYLFKHSHWFWFILFADLLINLYLSTNK